MNEMQERVAQALAGCQLTETWLRLLPETQEYFRARAVDSIRAMRVATQEMLQAMCDKLPFTDKLSDYQFGWEAAIDEALK